MTSGSGQFRQIAASMAALVALACSAAAAATPLDEPDACMATFLDKRNVEVVCGFSDVPAVEVDVETTFQPHDPDPFLPVPLGFSPAAEPMVVDLAILQVLPSAPYFECFSRDERLPSVRATGPGASRWDPQIVARVAEDVRRLSAGRPARCYDVRGDYATPGAAAEAELVFDSAAEEAQVDLAADGLSRSTAEGIRIRLDDDGPEVEPDTPSVLATMLLNSTVGADLRGAFDVRHRCPTDLVDLKFFDTVAALAVDRDYVVSVVSPTGRRGALMCAYNPWRDEWLSAGFHCADDSTCYAQVDPDFPPTCQPIDRVDEDGAVWRVRDENCFAMGRSAVEGREPVQMRHIGLELGVYLSIIDSGDAGVTYALIFPYDAPQLDGMSDVE